MNDCENENRSIILTLLKIKDKSMGEEQKTVTENRLFSGLVSREMKDESVGEKHNRIISIKEKSTITISIAKIKDESVGQKYPITTIE